MKFVGAKKISVAAVLVGLSLVPADTAFATRSTVSTVATGADTSTTSVAKTATSSSRLVTIKSKSSTAITARIKIIDNLKTLVSTSKYVTAGDKSGLLTELSATESGLTALNTQIQADTTTATATTDAKTIVTTYRVYVLEAPKVHEVLAIDTIAATDAKFVAVSPALAKDVQAAKSKGTDVTAAQTALVDLNSKAAAVKTTVSGLSGPVLALQPSGYPTNKTTLQSTRKTLTTLITECKGGRTDLKAIEAVLGMTTTSTTA